MSLLSRFFYPASVRRLRPRHWLFLLPLVFLAGCATAPATYRTLPTAAERVPKLGTVIVAPLDAELAELSAGGVVERREDWTQQAVANLTAALAAETGWTPATALTAQQLGGVREEAEEVQALLRAITLNHLLTAGPVRGPFVPANPGLSYQTGVLRAHADALGNDAVLFVFVRNSYATAGRKALAVLGVLGGAVTGIAIIPAMGSDVASAALVEKDGSVLWFNYNIGGADPRTPDGARTLARKILSGLPKASVRSA